MASKAFPYCLERKADKKEKRIEEGGRWEKRGDANEVAELGLILWRGKWAGGARNMSLG